MPIIAKTKDIMMILLMGVFIIGIVFGLFIGVTSIVADFGEDSVDDGLPKFPSEGKADTLFKIENTGQVVLSSDYTADLRDPLDEHDDLYILHGYYEDRGGKYKENDAELRLDELYFGDITVTWRE